MAVELIKDLLKIDQTIGKDQIEKLVESEILVPEENPINKILNVYGSVKITDTLILKDKISVDGLLSYKILYNSNDENNSLQKVEHYTEFNDEISIEGINEKMIDDIKCNIEQLEYNLVDENKISLNAYLQISGKVQSQNKIDIVRDIVGTKGLQILKDNIKYNTVVGNNVNTTTVKDVFELQDGLPDVDDILRVYSKAYIKESKVVEGKVIVAGLVDVSILYYSDTDDVKINHVTREMPFTQFIEIPKALKDMKSYLKVEVDDADVETGEDLNGDIRVLSISSKLKLSTKVYEQREKEITIDTYSTENIVNVKREIVNISENVGMATSRELVNGSVKVVDDNDIIKNVYNVNLKPIIDDYRIIDGKVIIEGLVVGNMLYLDEDSNEIRDSKIEMPYKSYVDIEGIKDGMECEAEITLDSVKYNKSSSREVSLESIVKTDVIVNRIKKINIVTEVEELDEIVDKSNRPSLTVYMVQKEDTLWDIAKRYNTTTDELIKTNNILSPENLMPGEKIIIEKNIELDF